MVVYLVESLVQQCQNYVLMHLEEFPVNNYLSLLPLSTRRDLLWQLPVADICLRLEDTDFTVGIDMGAFWTSTWEDEDPGVSDSMQDSDVKGYVQDQWNSTEYARETLYGLLATFACGHLRDGSFLFHSPYYRRRPYDYPEAGMSVFSLLYAVRQPCMDSPGCKLKFPLRYSHKSMKSDEDLTVYEVVNCFSYGSGEFPRIFPEVEIMNDNNLDHVYFLRNAVFVGIKGYPFEEEGFEFLKALLKEATNLEVLILHHWGGDDEWETKYFDKFCTYLSSCQAFLSNFRLFKLIPPMDTFGFVVSRKSFNELITAYFAAPTDHMQKLQFTETKIKCHDVSFEIIPEIDQGHLRFKMIEFEETCQFVSKYKPTTQTISHWLGQSITQLDSGSDSVKQVESCIFKVESKAGEPSRKRKHFELDAEDNGDK